LTTTPLFPPGHIKLKEALLVAGIIAAVTSSIDQIHDTYNSIQKRLSERKLTKFEVQISELELDSVRLKFVQESKKQLIDEMNIPENMQAELKHRSDGNELMELKILMSFHRRVEPIAIMQSQGMLNVEAPEAEDNSEQ
jgi:hypothetical protein